MSCEKPAALFVNLLDNLHQFFIPFPFKDVIRSVTTEYKFVSFMRENLINLLITIQGKQIELVEDKAVTVLLFCICFRRDKGEGQRFAKRISQPLKAWLDTDKDS